MDTGFLSGMLTAWSLTQVGFGVFFILAYLVARREGEYLVFGMLCLALALGSAGGARAYSGGAEQWTRSMQLLHSGLILAAATNLHFVMRYARIRRTGRIAAVAYTFAAIFEGVNALGGWWRDDAWHAMRLSFLGVEFERLAGVPTPAAMLFYFVGAAEVVAAVCVLYYAWRSGKREALSAMLAMGFVALAIINDIALVVGELESAYLLPHVFWVYCLAVASTLLLRYRAAAGELAETATNLQQRTEELNHSYAELREMHDELARKQQLAAVGELAAAIAHEVRNPLAIIVNAVSGLRRPTLRDDDRTMLLGIVDEETARLDRLVTDLLRFARPVKVRATTISLVDLAQRAQELEQTQRRVIVHVEDDPELRDVQADPGLLWLVFDNLVSNALQAMPQGGTVELNLERARRADGDWVCCRIRDDGVGMDARVLERAAHPFFTTRPSGTGLGLPIVQRIIEAHGGSIELESAPGAGTTVTFLLPLQRGAI